MKHTVHEVTLKNGARGLLINVPDASVMTLDFNFRAGEYLVEESKYEVPHIMEHVLLGANSDYPKARDFQVELERNGAYNNATTGVYDITYDAECADFEWERVTGLLLTAVAKPLFLDDEFAAEFGNIEEELASRNNNHFRRLSLEMRKNFGLIAKTDGERLELMKGVKVDDVREHYKRTHYTNNMRFVIAGKLTPARSDKLIAMLEAIELPKMDTENKTRLKLPDENPSKLDEAIFVENNSVKNIYFYVDTFRKTRLSDDESDALALLNTMLTETLYSRIFGAARERGLVYGMSSGLANTRDTSNWWFGAQVSSKNAPALIELIVGELIKIKNGELQTDEIKDVKQYALGRFQRSAQTVGGTASGYAGRYFFDGVIEDYDKVPARIKAVEKQAIIDVAKSMFKDDIWGFGVLGNTTSEKVDELQDMLAPLWSK